VSSFCRLSFSPKSTIQSGLFLFSTAAAASLDENDSARINLRFIVRAAAVMAIVAFGVQDLSEIEFGIFKVHFL